MKYVNTKTGAIIEFDGIITGGNWEKVTDSNQDEVTDSNQDEVTEKPKKTRKK